MTSATLQATTTSVPRAAFRAFAAWLVIYAVLSQLLVIPKWRSSSGLTAEEQAQVGVVDQDSVPSTIVHDQQQQDVIIAEEAPHNEERERRIQLIQKLVDDANEFESRHEQLVAVTIEQLKGIRAQVMKPLSKAIEEEESQSGTTNKDKKSPLKFPNLTFFKELMELPALSNVDPAKLVELSERMQSEVDEIVGTNATVSWSQVNAIVTARYPRVPVADASVQDCPTTSTTTTTAMGDSSPLARESHLYQTFQQTEKLLKKRTESMPPLLLKNPDGFVEELHKQAAAVASKQPVVPRVANSANVNSEQQPQQETCASHDDVTGMMDEGFHALHQGLDVRQVLTQFLLANHKDMKESDFILDAFLLDSGDRRPPRRNDATLNLRQVIDTPLLKKVPEWIDVAIDHVGGHVESLDQLVDRLAADDTSVGKKLVAQLQSLAGKVDLPNVWATVPTQAGLLQPGRANH